MKKYTLTEHSKKVKNKTNLEWQKQKHATGEHKDIKATLKDKELIEEANKLTEAKNGTKFIEDCIRNLLKDKELQLKYFNKMA